MAHADTDQDAGEDDRASLREALLRHPTGPIPDVGWAFLGLGRNASYAAANAGVLPTVQTGSRKKQALIAPIAQSLGLKVRF